MIGHRFQTLVLTVMAAVGWMVFAEAKPSTEKTEAQKAADTIDRIADAQKARIVNGEFTSGYPSTGILLFGDPLSDASMACTGTLIGCRTFLTAAHCVNDYSDQTLYTVFFQHAGFFEVASVDTNECYSKKYGQNDIAVLTLVRDVSGISPTPFNNRRRVDVGTEGTIVGFGRSGGFNTDFGVKRFGNVILDTCKDYDRVEMPDCTDPGVQANHVCWRYKLGDSTSNTCNGDSGGPLFADIDGKTYVVGVTSTGDWLDCLVPDHAWDSRVFYFRDWIRGLMDGDTGGPTCGDLKPLDVTEATRAGTLQWHRYSFGSREFDKEFQFTVPEGARVLRVAMNGLDDCCGYNNFDLFVRAGEPPVTYPEESIAHDWPLTTPADSLEAPLNPVTNAKGPRQFAFCEFESPQSGEWHVLVERRGGGGMFQLTYTVFME